MTRRVATRFGPPLLARVLYFLSGGLVFATGARAGELIGDLGFASWVAAMALFSSLGLIAWPASRAYQRRQQRRRDQRAAAVLAGLRAGTHAAYSLYLRGFFSTGKLPQLQTHHDFETRASPEPFLDMEALVAQAMEPNAPLIALGNPGEQVGAGRVATTEQDWQQDFSLLAAGAKALFLLPSETPGTLFEVEQIVEEQLWTKTILLMPREDRAVKWAERWEAIRLKVREMGLKLPPYRSCGTVFKIGHDGRLQCFQPLGHRGTGEVVLDVLAGNVMTPTDDLIECEACGYSERPTSPPATICGFCKRAVRATRASDERPCPSCGAVYVLADYRTDVAQIFCSNCKQPLPRT